jgi:hypothetical protein
MNHVRPRAPSLLALVILAAGEASAQARGPSLRERRDQRVDTTAEHAAQLTKLGGWLSRIHGQFQMSFGWARVGVLPRCGGWSDDKPGATCLRWVDSNQGTLPPLPRSYEGSVECKGVGDGAGVSCLFSWDSDITTGMPLAMLLGLDPDGPGIRFLLLDSSGSAREARGSISGNTVNFKMDCANRGCPRISEIYASSGGRQLEMLVSQSKRLPSGSLMPGPLNGARIMLRRESKVERNDGSEAMMAPP